MSLGGGERSNVGGLQENMGQPSVRSALTWIPALSRCYTFRNCSEFPGPVEGFKSRVLVCHFASPATLALIPEAPFLRETHTWLSLFGKAFNSTGEAIPRVNG